MALFIGPIIRKIKASLDPESQQQQQQQGLPPQQFQPQQFQPQPPFLDQQHQHQQHQHRQPCPSDRRGRRHARHQMRAARRCGRADGPGWCRGPPAAVGHCHPQQQQQQSRPTFAANYGPRFPAGNGAGLAQDYYERRSFERAPPPPAAREMTDARYSNEDVAPPAYESESEDEEDHYVQNGKGGGRVKV